MKIAYFDCEFGAAGDMLNGALLAAGASMEHLAAELAKLGLPGQAFELDLEDVIRCSYACKKFNVLTGPDKNYESGLFPVSASTSESPGKDLQMLRFPESQILKFPAVLTAEPAARKEKSDICPGTLDGVLSLLSNSGLSEGVKNLASEIFRTIYKAEASCRRQAVEGLDMNQMAFLDAIVDVVAFAVNYEFLAIEKSFVSPLPLGLGNFEYAGELNMGAQPATLEVVKEAGARISATPFNNECLTVTGAAILCTVASSWSRPSFEKITATGYGAGSYNPKHYPNACRVMIGSSDDVARSTLAKVSDRFENETILVLEANIDDLAPQSLAYASEKLLAAGALDVLVLPAVMKKGRSGHLLQVLCELSAREAMQEIMFNETSTIGVRSYTCERVLADRKWQEVTMDDGATIRVKVALDKSGSLVHAQPEYEDCATYATKYKIPLKKVVAAALARFNELWQ